MSRRTQAPKRHILPDPKHDSELLAKFINMLMKSGKKSVAEGIVYDALGQMSERTGQTEEQAVELLETALDNIKPMVEVKSRRVGGATYQVPMEVSKKRQQTLAIRTVVGFARQKKGKPMAQCLADELMDAYNRQGSSITWRENTHKMAEANKLFAHFAW